jgi:hypothetical protein
VLCCIILYFGHPQGGALQSVYYKTFSNYAQMKYTNFKI